MSSSSSSSSSKSSKSSSSSPSSSSSSGSSSKSSKSSSSSSGSSSKSDKKSVPNGPSRSRSSGGDWEGKLFLFIHKKNGEDPEEFEGTDQEEDVLRNLGSIGSYAVRKVELFGGDIPNAQFLNAMVVPSPALLLTATLFIVVSAPRMIANSDSRKNFAQTIKQDYQDKRLLSKAKTSAWIHHVFAIFELVNDDGHVEFASLEKFTHGIVMQVAPNKQNLLESTGDGSRHEGGRQVFHHPLEMDDIKDNVKFKQLVHWVFENEELKKKYKLLNPKADNCQNFAERLFISFAMSKPYPGFDQIKNQIYESLKNEELSNRDIIEGE